MVGNPTAPLDDETLVYKSRAVKQVLASIGHTSAGTASDEQLRAIIDQEVLPKISQLLDLNPPYKELSLATLEDLEKRIIAMRGGETFKSLQGSEGDLDKIKYNRLDFLRDTKAASEKIGIDNGPGLSEEDYNRLKVLPPIYVDNLKTLYALIKEPGKVDTFTQNLRMLVEAGKIGVKPPEPAPTPQPTQVANLGEVQSDASAAPPQPQTAEPPAPAAAAGESASSASGSMADAPQTDSTEDKGRAEADSDTAPPSQSGDAPAAQTGATSQTITAGSGNGATGAAITPPAPVVTPVAATQAAPSAQQTLAQQTPTLRSYKTVEEASEWAENYLGDYAQNDSTIPKPAAADGVFDEASKLSAWAVIESIKQTMGIKNSDGSVDGVYDASEATRIKQALAANQTFKQGIAQKFGSEKKLDEFLLAMDMLAINGKLATQKPQKKQEEPGFLDGIRDSIGQARSMMTQFLGAEKADGILRMVFGFVAQFLGPLLGRFGISVGPLFQAIGMGDMLDKDGNISPEKTKEAMRQLYEDAAKSVDGDPDKLKEAVLTKYREQMNDGSILSRFARWFADEDAMEKSLIEALDAAADKSLSIEERAKIFAETAYKKGEEAKPSREMQSQLDAHEKGRKPAAGAGAGTGSGAVNPPPFEEQRPPAQAAPPAAPGGEETQPPPPASPPPRRGEAVPQHDVGDVDFRALGARFLGKEDPGYQMVARAFAGAHQVDVVTAVQGPNILIGRYEQGELHVYNVNGKLGPLVANQSAGSKMIANSKLVINEGSDVKTVELLGNFHAAARARYSFDTKHTPEGRVKLRELVQKQEDAAYLLKTQHPGVLIGKAYGNTGPHVAKPMSGPYEGSVPESEPVKLLPKGSPIRHPDSSHSFTKRDTLVPLTAEEKAQRVDRVLAFDEAAKGASNEPIILRRGFSIHADPDGETKGTFRDNKKDVEGAAPTAHVVTNPYDLKETHEATADMERGR